MATALRDRFVEDLANGLVGKPPEVLFSIFNVSDVKSMMIRAASMQTNLQELIEEAGNYLGKLILARCEKYAAANATDVIPPECVFAIHVYTRNEVYAEINERLRSGAPMDHFRYLCICLMKGLSLLPEHSGKTYRGIGKVTSLEVSKAIKKGVVWTWSAFSSTSVAINAAEKFGKEFRFVIRGVYGRDISAFSQFDSEQEVLFVPGTMMRVVEVTDTACVLQELLVADAQLLPRCWNCGMDLKAVKSKFCAECGVTQPKPTPDDAVVANPSLSEPLTTLTTLATVTPSMSATTHETTLDELRPATHDSTVLPAQITVSAAPAVPQSRLLVLGGRSTGWASADVCQFDGAQWTLISQLSCAMPLRNRVCADSHGNVWLFDHGVLFRYDVTTQVNTPHSAVLSIKGGMDYSSLALHNDVLYAFGCGLTFRDIYSLNITSASAHWQHVGQLNTGHGNSVVGVVNDKIYIVGGRISYLVCGGAVECFDPQTHVCTSVAETSPVQDAGGCVYRGKLYVAGGLCRSKTYVNELWCYDPVSDSWAQLADMPTARDSLSLVVYNDRLYAIGGQAPEDDFFFEPAQESESWVAGSQDLDIVESYDVKSNTWRKEPNLPKAVHSCGAVVALETVSTVPPALALQLTATTLPSSAVTASAAPAANQSHLLVLGGVIDDTLGGVSEVSDVCQFDGQQWTPVKPMSRGLAPRNCVCRDSRGDGWLVGGGVFRYNVTTQVVTPHFAKRSDKIWSPASLVLHKDVLYAIGCGEAGDSSFVYSLDTTASPAKWQLVGTVNSLRSDAVAGVIHDKIYIVSTGKGECFDPQTGKFTSFAEISSFWCACACVHRNKLYVVGSYCGKPENRTDTLVCYDPASDAWTQLADMPTVRDLLSFAVYNDRLYAIGGVAGTDTDIVESYDVYSNTWRTEPKLPKAVRTCGTLVV